MAHSALVYLMQLLDEEMIQFSCRVLEIEEEKARVFLLRAYKVINKLNKFRILKDVPYSYAMTLKSEYEPLALTISEDFVNATRSPEVQLDSRGSIKETQNISFELHRVKCRLKDLLKKLDGEIIANPAPTLTQQRELVSDLLATNEELKIVIEFFLLVVRKAGSSYFKAKCLLQKLQGYNLGVVDRIKIAAEKAGDYMEDFLIKTSCWFEKNMENENKILDLFKLVNRLLDLKNVDALTNNTLGKEEEKKKEDCKPKKEDCKPEMELGETSKSNQDYFDVDLTNIINVIDELTRPPLKLTIVRIFEMSSTGKATLAEKVSHFPGLVQHFTFCALINGDRSLNQVLSAILHSIAQFSNEIHGQSIENKGKILYESLKGRKYLIILHGLQSFEAWDDIQGYFPDDKVGSRVLLSSVLNPESSWKLSLEHEEVMVGFDQGINEIIDELIRPPFKLSIVTITGMGGIGKTTLAKKILHNPNVHHHFHCLVWIDTVDNIDKVLSNLLCHISPSHKDIKGKTIEEKGRFLWQSLRKKKYLIVMDGLWNFEEWDAILGYFPDDNVGSRILITTRVTEFHTSINILKNPSHCMLPLNKHQSWELLEKLVFYGKKCPTELVIVGQQIAGGCGGLPLAIVVIAGILRRIPGSFLTWWSIMCDVTSFISTDPQNCLDIISLSYNYLPHHLKACFLYMGAFPTNYEVRAKYLLNLWIANGFLESRSRNYSEVDAREYLEDLIQRNLIFVGKRSLDGKVKTCFIPALIRQLCLREGQKENFMHVLEESAIAHVIEKQRHLISNLDNLDGFQLLPHLSHLRSFIWLNPGSDFTPNMILLQLSEFKFIRVLDIYFVPFDTFPLQLLDLLYLRYLALNVTYELDARISQLSNLQTFVIYGPWINIGEIDANPSLIFEFWTMPCLRNVYVKVPSYLKYSYILRSLPDVPPTPSNLQSFSKVTFSSCTKEILFLMPNLKKLGVSETKEDFENDELTKCFHNLSSLIELQTLKCSFYKKNGEVRNLDWGILPINLRKLTLNGGYLPWEKMKLFALLPKLETLKLKNFAFQGPNWVLDKEVFGSLKQLLIDNTDLVNWEVNWEVASNDNFPNLECLVLKSCMFLEKIPLEVGEFSGLRVIELHQCNESVKKLVKEFKEEYGWPVVITKDYK